MRKRAAGCCLSPLSAVLLWAVAGASAQVASNRTWAIFASKTSMISIRSNDTNFGTDATVTISGRETAQKRVLVGPPDYFPSSLITPRDWSAWTLTLTLSDTATNWPARDNVDVYGVGLKWAEEGATYNCANDTNLGNAVADCDVLWEGAELNRSTGIKSQVEVVDGSTADTPVIANLGEFISPVFQAARNGLNGFLVRKTNVESLGSATFHSDDAVVFTLFKPYYSIQHDMCCWNGGCTVGYLGAACNCPLNPVVNVASAPNGLALTRCDSAAESGRSHPVLYGYPPTGIVILTTTGISHEATGPLFVERTMAILNTSPLSELTFVVTDYAGGDFGWIGTSSIISVPNDPYFSARVSAQNVQAQTFFLGAFNESTGILGGSAAGTFARGSVTYDSHACTTKLRTEAKVTILDGVQYNYVIALDFDPNDCPTFTTGATPPATTALSGASAGGTTAAPSGASTTAVGTGSNSSSTTTTATAVASGSTTGGGTAQDAESASSEASVFLILIYIIAGAICLCMLVVAAAAFGTHVFRKRRGKTDETLPTFGEESGSGKSSGSVSDETPGPIIYSELSDFKGGSPNNGDESPGQIVYGSLNDFADQDSGEWSSSQSES